MGRAGGRGGGGGSRGGSFGGSRGGSFGGGRSSSSFGGSRSSSSFGRSSSSFGRSSSSFGSSGRSYSSGSRPRTSGGYSGGLWGMPRTTGPIIINNSGNNNRRTYGSGNNQPNYSNKNSNNNQSSGCIHIVLIIIMIMSLLMVIFNSVLLIGSGRQQRTKLNADINVASYYTDELHWINDKSDIERGLEYFYEKTGVQPHVYITDDVGGDFYECVEDFANDKYDEMFADEAHVLLIFWEQDYYNTYCLSGVTADTVIDSEARNIILDKLDEYYWDSSLDEDEYFSKAFSEAADEIMKKPPSGFGAVAVPLVIFIIALVIEITLRNKEKKAKKDAELKEMLDKPLETFGSTEAADLAKKYEGSEDGDKYSAAENAESDVPVPPKVSVETQYDTMDDVQTPEYCTRCGNKVEGDHIYCSNCGEKL